jgi:2-aminoadipate transaminase
MEEIPLGADSLDARLLPVEELTDCAHAVLAHDGKTLLSYGAAAGYTPLRELIAQWFGVHPFRVVLTNGWTHGFWLLVRNRVPSRGVVVEYPIHDRVQTILLNTGASLLGITMDELGAGLDELDNLLTQFARPAVIYTTPTFQNPTGWTMSLERRERLVRLVAQQKQILGLESSLLVENETYALTRFDGEALPALFDLSGQTSIYSASFSTLLGPGLRVGWWIVPEEIARDLTDAASSTYITPVLLAQATVYEFLRRGAFEPYLLGLREELRARRDALGRAVLKHLPGATVTQPEGGYFAWLGLPEGIDGRTVVERAEGVTAVAGNAFGAVTRMLRICFAAAAPDEIDAGIERLAAAL